MFQVLLTLLLAPLLRLFADRQNTTIKRILVIQVAKIGDVVCTSPLLRELRAGLPDAHITVLAGPVTAPLLECNPRLDAVVTVSPKDWRGIKAKFQLAAQLRREHYDAVLCCNGGAAWPVITLWAGIPMRIGIVPNFLGITLRLAIHLWSIGIAHRGDQLIVETYFDMLGALGLKPTGTEKEIFAADGAARRVSKLLPENAPCIGIAVSAANKLKELGSDKLAAVIQDLLSTFPTHRVVLLGTAADASRVPELFEVLDPQLHGRIVDTCGQVALADLAELIRRLKAFIGVDSGLTYIADALALPLVSVAGPCNMTETRPVNPHAIIIQRRLPCLPCAHIFRAPTSCHTGTLACIREIAPADIVAALRVAMSKATV